MPTTRLLVVRRGKSRSSQARAISVLTITIRRAVCTGTAPPTATDNNPTAATSYVPNSYFSFPYAPTSFANSASCASATKGCSENYDACLTNLGGSGFAVTVDVPGGGGTTVNGDGRNLGSSATSICSSLSSQACSKIQATKCDSFGQSSSTKSTNLIRDFALATTAGILTVFLIIT